LAPPLTQAGSKQGIEEEEIGSLTALKKSSLYSEIEPSLNATV